MNSSHSTSYKSKIISLLYFLSAGCFSAHGQSPNWVWANGALTHPDTLSVRTDYSNSVTADADGNSYITGHFESPDITFGNIKLINGSGGDAFFIVKYDSAGNAVWAQTAGGAIDTWGMDITSDRKNNLYITGFFSGLSITFGSITLTNTGGGNQIFIVKYDSSGKAIWAHWAKNGSGRSITSDAEGNVYVTGFFYPSTIFGNDTLVSSGGQDIFVVKYDSTGVVLWTKSTGGTLHDFVRSISTDSDKNVFVTGQFSSPFFIFGNDTLLNSEGGQIFILKYDSAGKELWSRYSRGSKGDNQGDAICTDALGNIYVTGIFSNVLSFGDSSLTAAGNFKLYIVKFDGNGNQIWIQGSGSSDSGLGLDIVSDSNNYIYVTGNASTLHPFGNFKLQHGGTFVVKLDEDGRTIWVRDAIGDAMGLGICVDNDNNIFITGHFYGTTAIFGTSTILNPDTSGVNQALFVAKLKDDISTTISMNQKSDHIFIYPNPATNQLTIRNENSDITGLKIFDLFGREVFRKETNINTHEATIDISFLASGMYLFLVSAGETFISKSFIKLNP